MDQVLKGKIEFGKDAPLDVKLLIKSILNNNP